MAGPIEQFSIKPFVPIQIGGLDLSFTNSSLWMVIAIAGVTLFMTLSMSARALVPGRWQSCAEILYEIIANMVRDNVGSGGRRYFPFIFTLFMFILFGNVLGMIPTSFTFTSHIIVTFSMAAFVFAAVTLIGLWKHKLRFFSLFFPHGAPLWTAPILIPIELVSYMSRPVSLSVRLFANMVVGHVLLKVIGGFVLPLFVVSYVGGIVPFVFLIGLSALELFVAVLQAYIFAILSCIYLHDALHLH